MAALRDLFGFRAHEDVDQVARAKPFLGSERGRKCHTHGGGAVENIRRFIAKVAVAAGLWILTKVAEQVHAAAM